MNIFSELDFEKQFEWFEKCIKILKKNLEIPIITIDLLSNMLNDTQKEKNIFLKALEKKIHVDLSDKLRERNHEIDCNFNHLYG